MTPFDALVDEFRTLDEADLALLADADLQALPICPAALAFRSPGLAQYLRRRAVITPDGEVFLP